MAGSPSQEPAWVGLIYLASREPALRSLIPLSHGQGYGKKGMLVKGYKETFMTIGGGWHFVPYMRTLLPNARGLVAQTQRVKQQPMLAVSSTPKIPALVSFHSFASYSTQTSGRPNCFRWFGLVSTKTMKLRV